MWRQRVSSLSGPLPYNRKQNISGASLNKTFVGGPEDLGYRNHHI